MNQFIKIYILISWLLAFNACVQPSKNSNVNTDNNNPKTTEVQQTNYKADFTLPLNFNNERDFLISELSDTKFKVKDVGVYEDAYIAKLPKYKNYKPAIISACDEVGECTEYLTIFDASNTQISSLRIGYSSTYELNEEIIYSTQYQSIDENYNITLKETTTFVDVENEKIINDKSKIVAYNINSNGQIVNTN